MTTLRRWCLLAVAVALFAGGVAVVAHRPAADRGVAAAALLAEVSVDDRTPYSGVVTTTGTLALPVAERFSDLGDLFGATNTMRVWWRSEADWRVNVLLPTGERDLIHSDYYTTEYSYEQHRSATSADPAIRLPRSADLMPPTLARRLLEGVRSSDAARLPARRIAGRDALGLRIRPAAPQSSVARIDLWVDDATGLPLRVEVYGRGAVRPAFTTAFRDVTLRRPAAATTFFDPPFGIDPITPSAVDIADAANRFSALLPPDRLGGLRRTSRSTGSVGVYGRGATQFIAIPVWDQAAAPLRAQLVRTPGARTDPLGTSIEVGPLSALLTGTGRQRGWLVAGSVLPSVLREAAVELRTEARRRPGGGLFD